MAIKEIVKKALPKRTLQTIYYARKYGARAAVDRLRGGANLDEAAVAPGERQALYEQLLAEQKELQEKTAFEQEAAVLAPVTFCVCLEPSISMLYQAEDAEVTLASLRAQTYDRFVLAAFQSEKWTEEEKDALCKDTSGNDALTIEGDVLSDAALQNRLKQTKAGGQQAHAPLCYYMTVRCGDTLAADAFLRLAEAIGEAGEPDILYTDSDHFDYVTGIYTDPCLKPDFSPEFLECDNYIGQLAVFSEAVLLRGGGFGDDAYDRLLRCTEQTEKIVHVPQTLYHQNKETRIPRTVQEKKLLKARMDEALAGDFAGSKKKWREALEKKERRAALAAKKRALDAHFARIGADVVVTEDKRFGVCHSTYRVKGTPLVSILIPSKDHIDDLRRCLDSLALLTYPNFEVIVIENNSSEPETFAYYEQLAKQENIRVVFWQDAFHFSAINNFGASYANGSFLLLLNNDTKVISTDLIERMLSHFEKPAVGVVGARLLYEDDTLQHAGIVIGESGVADPVFVGTDAKAPGYLKRAVCAQDYCAVTAACMLVRKSVYDEVGGLSDYLPVAYNDVDFCMKVRALGKRIVYEPCAQMYHYESKSRGYENTPEKLARMQKERAAFAAQWADTLARPDPYFHPLLSIGREKGKLDFHLIS